MATHPKIGTFVLYVSEDRVRSVNIPMQPFNGEPMLAVVTGWDDNGDLFLTGLPNEHHPSYDAVTIKFSHVQKAHDPAGRLAQKTWVPLSALAKQV